jgi:hypothetical protein
VLQDLRTIQSWPLWLRFTLMWMGLGAAYLLQIPLEWNWPGEPFLLFFLVVIGTTLCFGTRIGLISAGLSAFLSLYFFEPIGSPTLQISTRSRSTRLLRLVALSASRISPIC